MTDPLDDATFAGLGLRPELTRSLESLGYEEPTPIQREAIPPMSAGSDLLAQAATGTGKTAAFALPLLQRLAEGARDGAPAALVLVPTRELAMQVSEAVHRYGRELDARVVPIYGGQPIGRQLQTLRRGVDVVVATPGRALDHLQRGSLDLSAVQVVVLDEADEMLDMGFAEDLEAILAAAPATRQTVLFSATLPKRIDQLASQHLEDPVRIRIRETSTDSAGAPLVRQVAYVVHRSHKAAALGRVLDVEAPTAAIVFCRTRVEVDELAETLNGRGYRAEGLHGGMGQEQRDRVMNRLRSGTAELLIATDVAARGLDVDTLTHVVNYDVPSAPESYVHRIGRVGRAGRDGVAITLAGPRQRRLLDNIERSTGQKITVEKVPTVDDLRNRRLEATRDALAGVIRAGDLEQHRALVESLAEEFDLMEVALAAVAVAHTAVGGDQDEEHIPDASAQRPKSERPSKGGHTAAGRGDRGTGKGRAGPSKGMARIFVGAGRNAGVRPKDLVGAIANETSLSGKEIGSIHIAERHAVVEVPEGSVDEVVWAMRRSTVKGRKTKVRRDRDDNA